MHLYISDCTSVSHPGEYFDIQWWIVSIFLSPGLLIKEKHLVPPFPPSFYSVPVVYVPVKPNKKRHNGSTIWNLPCWRANREVGGWLISSWFQSAPLQNRAHFISSPQATALNMPKYANTSANGNQVPGFRFPLDRIDDGQSRAIYCLCCLGFEN